MLRPSVSTALFMTACLGAASGNLGAATGDLGAAAGNSAQSARTQPAAAPSQLDYLVLASMADSQRMLSMASYRPSP